MVWMEDFHRQKHSPLSIFPSCPGSTLELPTEIILINLGPDWFRKKLKIWITSIIILKHLFIDYTQLCMGIFIWQIHFSDHAGLRCRPSAETERGINSRFMFPCIEPAAVLTDAWNVLNLCVLDFSHYLNHSGIDSSTWVFIQDWQMSLFPSKTTFRE